MEIIPLNPGERLGKNIFESLQSRESASLSNAVWELLAEFYPDPNAARGHLNPAVFRNFSVEDRWFGDFKNWFSVYNSFEQGKPRGEGLTFLTGTDYDRLFL